MTFKRKLEGVLKINRYSVSDETIIELYKTMSTVTIAVQTGLTPNEVRHILNRNNIKKQLTFEESRAAMNPIKQIPEVGAIIKIKNKCYTVIESYQYHFIVKKDGLNLSINRLDKYEIVDRN